MIYICMVCNKPIGDDEPHDGSVLFQGKSRHWRCRPDADVPTMTFSETLQAIRDIADKLNDDELKYVNKKLRKLIK